MNIITFGKYKGMPVTRVLRIDPSYFGWCKNKVRGFNFSKRDYEICKEYRRKRKPMYDYLVRKENE